ncbi:MAG: hypothetical protein A4S09_13950 [Proteobacteria bacterium SG_bin7]|nr:MAG: hypothetical protein A4S09_13950 [Proteobacteria bacterium SG_bin7]
MALLLTHQILANVSIFVSLSLLSLVIEAQDTPESLLFEVKTLRTISDFKNLKEKIKKFGSLESKLTEAIAERLSEEAARGDLAGVDNSKLFYLAREWTLRELFDEERKVLTDVTWIPDYGKVTPVILSSYPIDDNSIANPQGIYFKKLSDLYLDTKNTIYVDQTWNTGGQKLSAEIKIQHIPVGGKLVTTEPSPKYGDYWKDRKKFGIIFASPNMTWSAQSHYLDHYTRFFQERDFVLSLSQEKINLRSLIKEKIISGELDYLIKNSHSMGDDRNIFELDSYVQIKRGLKDSESGIEEVFIAYPHKDAKSELVTNNEFGAWIRERQEKGGGELFYINGSCTSYGKAIKEIQATRSPLFVNIPTLNTYNFFVNNDESGLKMILDVFFLEKSYAEMDKSMRQSDWFKENDDYFIFPGSEEYKKEIEKNIRTPVEIEIKLIDGNGVEYYPKYL